MSVKKLNKVGILSRDAAPDLLKRDFDIMWMQRNEVGGAVLGQFFGIEPKNSGLTHTISSVTSQLPLPQENSDTDALPYYTPAPGHDKSIVLIEYASGIRVTDTMIRADRYDKIKGMMSGQIKSAMRLDEYARASIFDNAFTGTDGADDKALCDDSHPNEEISTGTWDNKGTGELTAPNLHALRLLARKMTDAQGDPEWKTPTKIVIPEDLEQAALELSTSEGKPGTALNDPNVLIKGLMPVVSPYLSSAAQYFLMCEADEYEKGLVEVQLVDWFEFDNSPANGRIVIDKGIKAIKAFSFTKSRAIFGSTGV